MGKNWKPSSSIEPDFYYDWLMHHHVLVKIYVAGKYLTLFDEKKVADNEVQHIEILLSGIKEQGKFYYTHATMRVYSPKRGYPSLIMTHWKSGPQPKSLSPDILINLAKTQLNDAENTLYNMRSMFRTAKNRVKEARAYPTVFKGRNEYTDACKALNVEALPDELCQSYTIQYGTFKFPDYSGDHCLTMKLARRRLRGILLHMETDYILKKMASFTIQGQQEWEPCKICEKEPRYLPLLVCAQCWPKKR